MDGVIVIDKPQGLTSHDVVAAARRSLREKRIGHTGTLDPLATGVLPLACGRATRLVRFLTASDKDYDATIRFGVATDTYDITGSPVSTSDSRPTREEVEAALTSLRGEYLQMPPAYSAKKVDGTRAYELARREETVALTPVPVRVERADVVAFTGDEATVAMTVSAGFYVRAFAHELGRLLGCGACLTALRRTRSGDFHVDRAIPFDRLVSPGAESTVVPLAELLPRFPAIRLTAEGRESVAHGRDVDADLVAPWVKLVDDEGELIALATPGSRPRSLHPSVVLI